MSTTLAINSPRHRGYLLIVILVYGSIFFVLFSGFMGYVVTQKQLQTKKLVAERALGIAEAGLNYYKWFLAHNPEDITNGTGGSGPYVIPYDDPEGGTIGEYSLDISANTACGDLMSVDIESTGHTSDDASVSRTVYARYARPTVSEYSYIINANVWAGGDRTIIGPYHSNGIIRMDGTNNSTVSSGQEEWVCDDSLPCTPASTGSTLPAVYGDGPNDHLWSVAVPPINFLGITLDLSNMQTRATADGRYFGPSGNYGYLLDFLGNDTFNLYRVTGTQSYNGYTSEAGWQNERHDVTATSLVAGSPFSIPAGCPLIFIEDKVWLEGDVSGKVTVAAADMDSIGVDPSMILSGNILYTTDDAGLLAIAERDLLVGIDVPDDMELNGIFIAQNGRFGRNHYDSSLPDSLDPYRYRNSLTLHGTIVSNGREGTKWSSGGVWSSGFGTRYNSYDRDLVSDPPPLAPTVSDTYEFIEWREMD